MVGRNFFRNEIEGQLEVAGQYLRKQVIGLWLERYWALSLNFHERIQDPLELIAIVV